MNYQNYGMQHPMKEYNAVALVDLENRYARNQLDVSEFDRLLEIYQVHLGYLELCGVLRCAG